MRLTVRRAFAYVVDVAALALLLVPLAFLLLGDAGSITSGFDVWIRVLVTVSAPAWAYFILTDRLDGRSVGKRLFGLRTVMPGGGSPGWMAAVIRTALKLLPWELTHLAFFGMAPEVGAVGPAQVGVAATAYGLLGAYVVVAVRQEGERSVADLVAGTRVRPAT